MDSLKKYLKQYIVAKGTPDANLGSIRGGLWRIPCDEKDKFFKLYVPAVLEMNPEHNTSFVFRPHPMDQQPFCMDIDFRTQQKYTLRADVLFDLAEIMCNKFEQCSVSIVMKEKGYFATVDKTKVYKSGGHLYFKNAITLAQSQRMREFAVEQIKLKKVFQDVPFLNPPEDVVDKAIPERSNGLMLIGDYKKNGLITGGRYMIKGVLHFKEGNAIRQHFSRDDFVEFLQDGSAVGMLSQMYDFVFKARTVSKKVVVKKKNVNKPKQMVIKINSAQVFAFNLPYFLSVINLKLLERNEWLQLLSFCKSQDLNRDTVCKLLNNAFTPQDASENGKVWDAHPKKNFVKKEKHCTPPNHPRTHYNHN